MYISKYVLCTKLIKPFFVNIIIHFEVFMPNKNQDCRFFELYLQLNRIIFQKFEISQLDSQNIENNGNNLFANDFRFLVLKLWYRIFTHTIVRKSAENTSFWNKKNPLIFKFHQIINKFLGPFANRD